MNIAILVILSVILVGIIAIYFLLRRIIIDYIAAIILCIGDANKKLSDIQKILTTNFGECTNQ